MLNVMMAQATSGGVNTLALVMTQLIVNAIVALAIYIVFVIGAWRVFAKADRPGWWSIIPILECEPGSTLPRLGESTAIGTSRSPRAGVRHSGRIDQVPESRGVDRVDWHTSNLRWSGLVRLCASARYARFSFPAFGCLRWGPLPSGAG